MTNQPVIFCAIDTSDLGRAVELAQSIGPVTKGLKLGLEFFNAFGPHGLLKVQQACPAAVLFVDLKYHDIPNTVAGAVRSICKVIKPAYLNVHASGGLEMMRAAKEACAPETKLLGVTVLTSMGEDDLKQIGIKEPPGHQVVRLAKLAQQADLDGIVCSAKELDILRSEISPGFLYMVPGIRPAGADQGDQKRIMTPREALDAGASHLVIGRPITKAEDPAAAAQAILDDIAG